MGTSITEIGDDYEMTSLADILIFSFGVFLATSLQLNSASPTPLCQEVRHVVSHVVCNYKVAVPSLVERAGIGWKRQV